MRQVVFALLLGACATAAPIVAPMADPGEVIAAERAFAARAGEIGWVPAFREYTAPDGQLAGRDGFVNAPQSLAETPDDGDRTLYWQPDFAGIARSGDLGFTAGPVSFDGARTPRVTYFTVWRRQPDGAWKWIYDGGPGATADPGPFPSSDAEVEIVAVAASGAGSAEAAVAEVRALEDGASAQALAARLAPEARVYRTRQTRARGADAAAAMAYPSPQASYRVLRAEASAAGDLAFTLGETLWSDGDQARTGQFARIWQRRPEGWRIVYDQIVLPPPRP